MKRAIRLLLLGFGASVVGLAVLIFVGFWTAQWALDKEKLTPLIERQASFSLHRALTIGDIERPGFPVTSLVARNVRLLEKDGNVIVDCPEVQVKASVLSVLELRLGIENMVFKDAMVNVRFRPDGKTNIEAMIDEIRAHPKSRVRRSVGALVFHHFTLERGSVTVTNAAGEPLLPRPAAASGRVTVKISPATGITAPYKLDVDGGEGGLRLSASGKLSSDPSINMAFERLPAALLAPRMPALNACAGDTDGRLSCSRTRGKVLLDLALSPNRLCGGSVSLPDRFAALARHDRAGWTIAADVVGASTTAHADVSIPATGPFQVTASAPKADLTEVTEWRRGIATLAFSSATGRDIEHPARPWTARVTASTFTAGRFPVNNVTADVRRSTTGVINVDRASASFLGGNATGRAEISSGTLTMEADAKDWDLDRAADVFKSTATLKGQLSGRLTGKAPVANPIGGFDGHLSATLAGGHIPKVPAVLNALTSANLVKLQDELKGDEREGIEVTKGEGDAKIVAGVAEIEKLFLDSRVLKVVYTGKIDLVARKLDGTLVLQPLNLADQVINDIPVLRDLILGDGKTFLPLYFYVKGEWMNPKVSSRPARSLLTPVRNVIEGILKLPGKAIDAVRGKK